MESSVFVSYAHASGEHRRRVAELVAYLRAAGLRVAFDGDVRTPQGPPEGWPRWMQDQIEAATWVLVVCEEVYYRRFRGRETPGAGKGARWEGAIIRQELYDHGALNRKFIPVLLDGGQTHHIPESLHGATHYRCPNDLKTLTAAIQGQREDGLRAADGVPGGAVPLALTAQRRRRVYAVLAVDCIVVALVLVCLWLWNARELASGGESIGAYYRILVALGAVVAALLYGALRALARSQGRDAGASVLSVGGPVLAGALVVLGGAWLFPPTPDNFALTVFVHGEAGPHELLPPPVGNVLLDVGGDRRREPIGDKGQAFFPEVPANFRGRPVKILVESVDYELADPREEQQIHESSVYLRIRRKSGHISGRVQDEDGHPIAGAHVDVAGLVVETNATGNFEMMIPGNRMKAELPLEVRAAGFTPWRSSVVPNANGPEIKLTRER